uniref:Uncharacterized protein n=1 Tax=Oryza punctata TaxID=4537 RepID=A0A0E0JJQ2_ORYPU
MGGGGGVGGAGRDREVWVDQGQGNSGGHGGGREMKQLDINTYETGWHIMASAGGLSMQRDKKYCLAVAILLKQFINHVKLVQRYRPSQHQVVLRELNDIRKSDYCGPLTSFNRNNADPQCIGTSSINNTCTI